MASVEKDMSAVPNYFLSPATQDDIVLVVEGVALHVSKGTLGQVSQPLGAIIFGNTDTDNINNNIDEDNVSKDNIDHSHLSHNSDCSDLDYSSEYSGLDTNSDNEGKKQDESAEESDFSVLEKEDYKDAVEKEIQLGNLETEEHRIHLHGKKLEDVIAFLLWLCRVNDPKAEEKTYSKAGRLLRIAMEDMGGLLGLAEEWMVDALKTDCDAAFMNYVREAVADKAVPLKALGVLEAVGKNMKEAEFTDLLNILIDAGVTVDDLVNLKASDAFSCRVYKLVMKRMAQYQYGCFHCGKLNNYCVHGYKLGSCYYDNPCTPKPCSCPGGTNQR